MQVQGGSGEYDYIIKDMSKVTVRAQEGDSAALLHAAREGQTTMRIQDKNVCFNYQDIQVSVTETR